MVQEVQDSMRFINDSKKIQRFKRFKRFAEEATKGKRGGDGSSSPAAKGLAALPLTPLPARPRAVGRADPCPPPTGSRGSTRRQRRANAEGLVQEVQ